MQTSFLCCYFALVKPTNGYTQTTKMTNQFFNTIASKDSVAIMLYGDVGHDCRVDSSRVVPELVELEREYKNIDVRINSVGGDVFSGMAIYAALKASKANITIYIDGVAASIAAIIALCGKRLVMSPFAKLMLHRVSGGTYGNSAELRKYADLMETLENDLASMIAERCKMSVEEIKTRYFDGQDHWLNAKEAVAMGLADEIYTLEDDEAAAQTTTDEIYKYFNNKLENQMSLVNQLQSLPTFKGLDETGIYNKVLELANKAEAAEALRQANEEYKNQLDEFKEKEVSTLLNQAIEQGKITEAQRTTFENLLKVDKENALALLNSMTAKKDIKRFVNNQGGQSAGNLLTMSWDEVDKAGRLTELKAQHKEVFCAKFKERFGEDYKD